MIYYFSGTGNSKWVAQQMAAQMNEQMRDIIPKSSQHDLQEEKFIGFVFPIYAWGVCKPMMEFVKQLPPTSAFTFAICTCGADNGNAMKELKKVYRIDSCYSIEMPSNYIIGEDLEPADVIEKKIAAAKQQIENMAREILEHRTIMHVHEGSFPWMKTKMIHPLFERFATTTRPFTIDLDRCNGCGWCAAHCPAATIQMVDGKPTWNEHCYQCLRCLNGCPQTAINYGKHTQDRKRYRLEEYLKR